MAKVLTVDDAMFMRTMLRRILEPEGFEVVEAEDGAHGVEAYKEHQPDVVLMDVTMPNMDGIEATRAIKAVDPNARIIICSALGQEATVIKATEAGACDYVTKPFQPQQVLEAVKRVLSEN